MGEGERKGEGGKETVDEGGRSVLEYFDEGWEEDRDKGLKVGRDQLYPFLNANDDGAEAVWICCETSFVSNALRPLFVRDGGGKRSVLHSPFLFLLRLWATSSK